MIPPKKILLLAGAKKGLLLFSSRDRRTWQRTGPFQPGREINHAVCAPRDGRLWAAANDSSGIYREGMALDTRDPAGIYFGANTGKIFHSADEGGTWRLLADNLPPVFYLATGTVP